MSATYCTCIGMRGERTARGSRDGVRASVQSWDGSVITRLWLDENDKPVVRIGISDNSSSYESDTIFRGSFDELKEAAQLLQDIRDGKVSVVRHRAKSNKQIALERAFR